MCTVYTHAMYRFFFFWELNSSNFKLIHRNRNDKVSSENGIGFNNGNPVTNSSAGYLVTIAINPIATFQNISDILRFHKCVLYSRSRIIYVIDACECVCNALHETKSL